MGREPLAILCALTSPNCSLQQNRKPQCPQLHPNTAYHLASVKGCYHQQRTAVILCLRSIAASLLGHVHSNLQMGARRNRSKRARGHNATCEDESRQCNIAINNQDNLQRGQPQPPQVIKNKNKNSSHRVYQGHILERCEVRAKRFRPIRAINSHI